MVKQVKKTPVKKIVSKVDKNDVLFLALGGTIDKDYPRLLKGYAFEFGEPAVPRIL